ncbi:MAG: helix-turn-helix domain-containing protein [Methylobacter sp.]
MGKQYRSNIMASIHETAEDLYEAGLMEKRTMREFDGLCLTPISPLKPEQIRDIRERENVSQVVFANYLNVSKGIISQWERGEKRPSGTSLKLLSLVEKKGLSAIS